MSFGLTDILGNVSGFPNVTVYGPDGKLKVVGGSGGGAVWGSITGTITAQTDLITYLSGNYVPLTRNITINGVTQDLSADRTWTISAGTGTVTSVQLTAGTGISLSGTNPITTSGNITVTNSAPDQTVVLTGGTGISTSGTYPNFTITNTSPDQTVSLSTTGTGLAVTGSYPNFTLQNTLPDQTVSLTAGTGISVSGTYPSFTIGSTVTGGVLHGTATGTDTYAVTISGPTSYADGDAYLIRFTNGNTTGCTLDINGLGAVTLYRNNDGPLIGGDIQDGSEMLCIYNSTLTAFQVIGTSPNSLIAYVTNDDSVTITKGQPVYAFSGTGDRMTVKLANNTTDATSAQTIGLVLSTSIAANQKGFIMMQGLLDGLSNVKPVNGWSDGSPVYLGATAGTITPTKPYAPNHLVYLGFVTTASPGSAGRVYVRVQNGYELDELHNVQAQTPTYKDTLWYDNTVSPSQWKTASIGTILGYTPVPTTRTISTTSPLTGGGDLSADRTIAIPAATSSVNGYLTSTDWTTFNNKAPLASPAFTGNPTAPTPSFGDNDTSIATTAFVQAAANTPSLIKVNANLTAAVNSTSLTTLYSFYIPANTVAAGDMIHVVGRARKSPIAANGSCSMRIYVNTSATAGGSIVGLLSTGAANNVYMHMRRDISITNATNSSIVFINTTTAGDDATASNGASNVLVIDWTVDQYIILGITPGSATDTWYGMGFRAEIKKYNL